MFFNATITDHDIIILIHLFENSKLASRTLYTQSVSTKLSQRDILL